MKSKPKYFEMGSVVDGDSNYLPVAEYARLSEAKLSKKQAKALSNRATYLCRDNDAVIEYVFTRCKKGKKGKKYCKVKSFFSGVLDKVFADAGIDA